MIGYRLFPTEQDFMRWQEMFPENVIHGIAPVPMEMKGEAGKADFGATVSCGAFVTYTAPAAQDTQP